MDIELFIDDLKRDKASGSVAPHQIILLISILNLYTSVTKKHFNVQELIKEFDENWNRYKETFKSKNKSIGLPLRSLKNKGLITIQISQPIKDYRNLREISLKIEKISLDLNLVTFLKSTNLKYLESRINT